ncbi:MAG: DUF5362 family protein [Chitinophagaceae bacterium]|jgi:hypothetical protein|nr:DUF5362 family protein [Chitinophagaceae bacterium]
MEENSLFDLSIDMLSQDNLKQTAKWGKFLSVVGFVGVGFMILFALFFRSLYTSSLYSEYSSGISGSSITITYLLMGILYFFPTLFLYRFSTQMLRALAEQDQNLITSSFSNLKACFRFVGVLTIIGLVFVIICIVFLAIGIAASKY